MGIYVGAKVFLIYEVRPGRVQAPRWWALRQEWDGRGWRGDTSPVPQQPLVVEPEAQAQREVGP